MTMTTFSQADDSLLAQISALVDGELSGPEVNELLIHMQARPELTEYWQRLQQQRSVYSKHRLADPKIAFLNVDLSDRVRQIIAADAPETSLNNVLPFKAAVASAVSITNPNSSSIKDKFKALRQYNRTKAGWSIAASVALVALISLYQNQTPELSAVNMPELAQVITQEPASLENTVKESVKVAATQKKQDVQLASIEETPSILPVEEDASLALGLEYSSSMEQFHMTHSAQAALPWGAGLMPFGRMIETNQIALFEEEIVQPDAEE